MHTDKVDNIKMGIKEAGHYTALRMHTHTHTHRTVVSELPEILSIDYCTRGRSTRHLKSVTHVRKVLGVDEKRHFHIAVLFHCLSTMCFIWAVHVMEIFMFCPNFLFVVSCIFK